MLEQEIRRKECSSQAAFWTLQRGSHALCSTACGIYEAIKNHSEERERDVGPHNNPD